MAEELKAETELDYIYSKSNLQGLVDDYQEAVNDYKYSRKNDLSDYYDLSE